MLPRRLLGSVVAGCEVSDAEQSESSSTATPTNGYGSTGLGCGAWPRVAVDTAEGTCLGLVAASSDGQFKPRVLLELPGRAGELLISDLDKSWAPGKGRLWYLDARDPSDVVLKPILGGLHILRFADGLGVTAHPEDGGWAERWFLGS